MGSVIVDDDVVGRFAQHLARLEAALRAGDHLHAARVDFALPRAEHAEVAHDAMSNNVAGHEAAIDEAG